MLVNKDFLTWPLVDWRLCCQPITCQIRKSLLTDMDFNIACKFLSNNGPSCYFGTHLFYFGNPRCNLHLNSIKVIRKSIYLTQALNDCWESRGHVDHPTEMGHSMPVIRHIIRDLPQIEQPPNIECCYPPIWMVRTERAWNYAAHQTEI